MKIDPRKFNREIAAAGLSDVAFGYNPEAGTFTFADDVAPARRQAVQAVFAAHDPTPDPAEVLRDKRVAALDALIGNPQAETALDGFFKSIKTRQNLPAPVVNFIAEAKL